jgi:hypothetical protein
MDKQDLYNFAREWRERNVRPYNETSDSEMNRFAVELYNRAIQDALRAVAYNSPASAELIQNLLVVP